MNQKKETVLILGGTGFIGQELMEMFFSKGYLIKVLTRSPDAYRFRMPVPCELVKWDGKSISEDIISSSSIVVNLAGAPIVEKRWTSTYKKELRRSRIESSKALAKAIDKTNEPPHTVIQASAVGFYQGNKESICNEQSQPGSDFIAQLCSDWEQSISAIESKTRLVIIRIGVVLGWRGGALPQLWDLYASGMGSVLGSGQQWMNWIHIDDLKEVFLKSASDAAMKGVYNAVAPQNATNKNLHDSICEFTPSLKIFKTPKIIFKLVMGERSGILLESFEVRPKRLILSNFRFRFRSLSEAMRNLVSMRSNPSSLFLTKKQWLPVPIKEVWDFSSKAQNLEKITPDFLNFKIRKSTTKEIQKGTQFTYSISLHGLPMKWKSLISTWNPPHSFTDIQLSGPYGFWHHEHYFIELENGTLIEDRIDFKLPFFPFGSVALPFVRSQLEGIFEHRQKAYADALCD